ncbi:MAG TPA: signal recognition particle-docking protein FtsY [Candidatus Jeotgalibaca merdavium]|uniref:Signal recognition particle receptor FtsY n=2 Tax=Jeotgalibaca TaxID=1470540 RepID=A0A6G7KBX6_9LACT|nr:signal recognition particle-docking protein FtsY [Jeotgalibaca arthritidis]QII82732.1 signal recognition particle-docking protein FtsY [Jeotgalibaca arthritidis]HJA89167.1 signal recognition particle-docking protein FtsY [Candidatus Jeotgalibaca merdavium]
MGLFDRIKRAFTGEDVTTQPVNEEKRIVIEKYDKGMEKTRKSFSDKINELFAGFREVDEDFFDDLEEILISADVGFDMTLAISDVLREEVKLKNVRTGEQVKNVIVEKMVEIYEKGEVGLPTINENKDGLTVILFVGVNGVGKTTTIGKYAHKLKSEGKKVLLAAGDTFRAGAIEQLEVWGERVGVDVVTSNAQSDPAAVVFDALKKGQQDNYDYLLIDTAGRLQNKVNLMKELEKINRIITREVPGGASETLLVLDATTGQNALIQAKQFKETTDVTGLILTKLDGTAKGGVILAIRQEMAIPVKFVGLGESMDDLQVFDPEQYIYGLVKDLVEVKK